MLLLRQLLLGVGGDVHGEGRLRGGGEAVGPVGEGDVPAPPVGGILLGLQVVLVHGVHRLGVYPQVRGLVLVLVALVGAVAKVLHRGEVFGQKQPHSKPGQPGEPSIPAAVQAGVHAALGVDGPLGLHPQEGGHGQRRDAQLAGDAGPAVLQPGDLDAVHLHRGPVVARQLPLVADVLVVVRGGPVQVPAHGLLQVIAILPHQGVKQPGVLVEHIAELLPGQDHRVPGLLQLHRPLGGGVQEEGLVVENDLVKAQGVPGGAEVPRRLGGVGEEQGAHPALRQRGQYHLRLPVGGQMGQLQLPAVQHFPVLADLIGHREEVLGVGEVQVVVEDKGVRLALGPPRPDGPDHVLILQQAGVGGAVGVHQAVHAEIPVVGELPEVPAVPVDGPVVRGGAAVDGVVAPLPHKAAAEAVVLHNQLLVVLRVPGAVAHGVDVLALDKGQLLVRQVLVQVLPGEVVPHLVQRGVHAAVQVQHGEVGLSRLVVGEEILVVQQPGGVVLLGPAARGLKILAPAALVAQRPDHHRGVVLVPDDAALHPVQNGLPELGVVGGVGVILVAVVAGAHGHAVGLHVRLADDVEAVLRAHLQKPGGVGVVAGADGVDVVALHQGQVQKGLLPADGIPGHRVAVVAVDPPELDVHPV